jgi:2-oxo-hept-3-ene-1,7-dioate hydratase
VILKVNNFLDRGQILEIKYQRELAKLLAGLRKERQQQSGLNVNLIPPTRVDAYRVAFLVEQELGWEVSGWKIAATNMEMQQALRTDTPIYGRVYKQFVKQSPCLVNFEHLSSPIPEAEYQAFLGKDLPPKAEPYEINEVSDAVASLHPGLELAECRFKYDKKFPPLEAILSDGAGSGVLVYGLPIVNWRNVDIANQEVSLFCNDTLRRKGTASTALKHPLVPLTWLANELSQTGIGMKKGQIISTGTLTGMLIPKKGDTYVGNFGALGTVSGTYG